METKFPSAALILATLFTLPRADASEPPLTAFRSLPAQADPTASDRSVHRSPDVPMYEDFLFVEDYRVNQGILGAIRWGTLVPVAGGLLGSLLIRGEESYGAYKGILAGFAVGIPVGAALGYRKGREYEERQARDGRFHAPRLRFGYEMEAGASVDNGNGSTGLALGYRLPSAATWSPDEIQAIMAFGSRTEGLDDFRSQSVLESRYGLRFLKSLRDGVFSPYFGATVGYAEGQLDRKDPNLLPHQNLRDFRSPFVDVLAGLKLNLFDLAHLKAQASYEPFGLWQQVRDEGDFPHQGNFQWRAAIGTYIF